MPEGATGQHHSAQSYGSPSTPGSARAADDAAGQAVPLPEGAQRQFRPSAAALNWVISIGFLSLGYAMYLRYVLIEQSNIGLACDAGLKTWLCLSRTVVSALFDHEVFGWVAVGAALLALIRPTVPLFTIGLAAAAFGIVLYNGALAGLAAGLLILCFARPVVESA